MAADALIESSNAVEHDSSSQHTEGTATGFNWQVQDTALLLPNQLGISKVTRAWDRKPKTPYSRSGSRVGKVWKRPENNSRPTAMVEQDGVSDSRVTKRRKARRSSPGGERKPLKKMCLDSGFGLAPRVLAWDGGESPTRKIVTRTSTANEELIALPDEIENEEKDDEAADVTVEILDEDGTVLDVNPEEVHDADWEDEDQEEPVEEDEFNETMMHLADIINGSQQHESTGMLQLDIGDAGGIENIEDLPEIEQENQDPALTQLPEAFPALQPVPPVLPEGFVSPMKPAVPVVKNRRRSFGPRRRTLPRQFAPSPLSQVMNMEDSFHEPAGETDIPSSPTDGHGNALDSVKSLTDPEMPNLDGLWEDVDEVSPPPVAIAYQDENSSMIDRGSIANLPSYSNDGFTDEITAAKSSPEHNEALNASPSSNSPQHLAQLDVSGKLPSSPIPTIEGQHPRLPLRRSPRRKSSSPRKKSTILPSTERPHLVAFTPVKGFPQSIFTSAQQSEDTELPNTEDIPDVPSSPIERAASAPPEEPQMSPRKPVKPRVSDDTALLQAFLNRAAENKGSRRMSAAKRESITNRRDSGSVRQALGQSVASPAKTDVLGELDVNSPSPRKSSISAMDTSAAFDEVINEAAKAAQDDMDTGEDSSVGHRTRRSGRGAKKAQPATPAAPNKIAIKGSAENVVLKRSEAQEMALLTRTNTRKNKGGAVLPPLRLTKMGSQPNPPDADASADGQETAVVEKPVGAKGVKWATILAEYFQGGDLSESSMMSDELNATTLPAIDKWFTNVEDHDTAVNSAQTAPPASETPSKPKIRRLKASRTAATPGKPPAALEPPAELEKLAALESKPMAPMKRRSRIATPAKGLTNASLLPSELDPQPVVPAPAAETKRVAPAKKKAPLVSKLPGPASSTTTSLGQGKENLISSPAKKKPSIATTKNVLPTAKTFAPKLDFSKSTKLERTATLDVQNDVVPGLMSPAKKGGRSRNVFASAKESESDGMGVVGRIELPGLSSPAKKRTRRAM